MIENEIRKYYKFIFSGNINELILFNLINDLTYSLVSPKFSIDVFFLLHWYNLQ